MQAIALGLGYEPDITLIASAYPIVTLAFLPAIKDGLKLALIIGMAEREAVLGPDQKRGPVAACVGERTVQRVQLRRGHADIHGAFCDRQYVRARLEEEVIEFRPQVVIHDRELTRGFTRVRNRKWRVAEDHTGQFATENFVHCLPAGCVAAQEAMLAENPEIPRPRDHRR